MIVSGAPKVSSRSGDFSLGRGGRSGMPRTGCLGVVLIDSGRERLIKSDTKRKTKSHKAVLSEHSKL